MVAGTRVIRWILGIAIIVIVFCFGVMIGQFKGALEELRLSDDAHVILWRRLRRAYPMMQGGYGGAATNGTQSQGGPGQ